MLTREEMQQVDLVPNEIRDKIIKDTEKNEILKQLMKVIEDREEER